MRKHTPTMAALALFLSVSLLFSALFARIERNFSQTASTEEDESCVIILDAGHGGEDAGAVGENGVLEKDLNLSLTRTLADLLRGAGHTVVETRTEDRLLCAPDTKKGHRKSEDLKNRLAFAEQYENCIFVSIHMNTFPNDTCRGTQVWYSQNDERSAMLASAVQGKVRELLQSENNRKIKAATSSIYLLRHASVPAILIECGFLTTPSDCEKLCDDTYRKMLALAIFEAIGENFPLPTCEET